MASDLLGILDGYVTSGRKNAGTLVKPNVNIGEDDIVLRDFLNVNTAENPLAFGLGFAVCTEARAGRTLVAVSTADSNEVVLFEMEEGLTGFQEIQRIGAKALRSSFASPFGTQAIDHAGQQCRSSCTALDFQFSMPGLGVSGVKGHLAFIGAGHLRNTPRRPILPSQTWTPRHPVSPNSTYLVVSDIGNHAVHLLDVSQEDVQHVHAGYIFAPGQVRYPGCVAASKHVVAVVAQSSGHFFQENFDVVHLARFNGRSWIKWRLISGPHMDDVKRIRFFGDGSRLQLLAKGRTVHTVGEVLVANGACLWSSTMCVSDRYGIIIEDALQWGEPLFRSREQPGGWLVQDATFKSIRIGWAQDSSPEDPEKPAVLDRVFVSNNLLCWSLGCKDCTPVGMEYCEGLGILIRGDHGCMRLVTSRMALAMGEMSRLRASWMSAVVRRRFFFTKHVPATGGMTRLVF
jgi:hypothetical protein